MPVRGNDYVYPGPSGGRLSNFKNEMTGCGPFLHDDPQDRPPDIFGGVTTLHFGRTMPNYLLLPVVPVQPELFDHPDGPALRIPAEAGYDVTEVLVRDVGD